jgi:hypothetical protein
MIRIQKFQIIPNPDSDPDLTQNYEKKLVAKVIYRSKIYK